MPRWTGVSMKTLLANGAIIFVYKLRKNLDLGIGAGLTNSYGIPMILPMMYFSWRNAGRYELKVDMSSGMRSVRRHLAEQEAEAGTDRPRYGRHVCRDGSRLEIENLFYRHAEVIHQSFVPVE